MLLEKMWTDSLSVVLKRRDLRGRFLYRNTEDTTKMEIQIDTERNY